MTEPFQLIAIAALLPVASAVMQLFFGSSSPVGQRISACFHGAAAVVGIAGALMSILSGRCDYYTIEWGLPFGPAEMGLDPLAAWFLIPVFLVSACCSVYGLGYWPVLKHPGTSGRLTFFFSLLTTSLIIIVTSRHAVLFLIAWEIMALSCFFAMTIEDRKASVQDAGILYLITAHIGALALIGYFSLLKCSAGSFAFPSAGSMSVAGLLPAAIFISGLMGFGIKAGLMPLHVWLPSAHANAPSHVSAIMSGVLIKMGIYGILRMISFFQPPPLWWGMLILVTGIVSAVAGVAFALGQHDLKRLLAYHSIENIGIIAMGIGVSVIGTSIGLPSLALLGMAGALLHVLNHALFKSLLFLGAGSVINACETREIDHLGGLARRMPVTSVLFLAGSVAICGLPPLNGFISELLIYLGIFRGITENSGTAMPLLALAAPALALVGALAVACFVKVYGIAFLGVPRSREASGACESPKVMTVPMGVIAACCLMIGIFPMFFAEILGRTAVFCLPSQALSAVSLSSLAPLDVLTILGPAFLILVLLLYAVYRRLLSKNGTSASETWGCGYLAPTVRMQYTASSFAEMLVGLLQGILRPHEERPLIKGYFPKETKFSSHVPEALLELFYLPLARRIAGFMEILRKLQHGQLHLYILYIVLTLVLLLAWSSISVRK